MSARKKGDLTLLKNSRPVAWLCMDYKLLSKVLANRLKYFMDFCPQGSVILRAGQVHHGQSVPDKGPIGRL